MTYELSQTPEEPATAPPVKLAAPTPQRPPESPGCLPGRRSAERQHFDERPSNRVINAKPISTSPPDPRDTTREIEKEARRPEYRESPRQFVRLAAEPVQPRGDRRP